MASNLSNVFGTWQGPTPIEKHEIRKAQKEGFNTRNGIAYNIWGMNSTDNVYETGSKFLLPTGLMGNMFGVTPVETNTGIFSGPLNFLGTTLKGIGKLAFGILGPVFSALTPANGNHAGHSHGNKTHSPNCPKHGAEVSKRLISQTTLNRAEKFVDSQTGTVYFKVGDKYCTEEQYVDLQAKMKQRASTQKAQQPTTNNQQPTTNNQQQSTPTFVSPPDWKSSPVNKAQDGKFYMKNQNDKIELANGTISGKFYHNGEAYTGFVTEGDKQVPYINGTKVVFNKDGTYSDKATKLTYVQDAKNLTITLAKGKVGNDYYFNGKKASEYTLCQTDPAHNRDAAGSEITKLLKDNGISLTPRKNAETITLKGNITITLLTNGGFKVTHNNNTEIYAADQDGKKVSKK